MAIKGRDLMNGVPREVTINETQVAEALADADGRAGGFEVRGVYMDDQPPPAVPAETWRRFAEGVFERAAARGAKTPSRVTPIATADYPTPARRPAYSVLDKSASWAAIGGPAPAIVEACADDVDLLVAGSHAHGAMHSALVGSVARYLVDHAPCAVLVGRERILAGASRELQLHILADERLTWPLVARTASGEDATFAVGDLRVDLARGLGEGGRWELIVEASPAFWDFL